MVTISDKISLIIDIHQLFQLQDSEVQAMINGDTYRITELYKKNLEFIKTNYWYKFKHIMTGETMSLDGWMKFYRCDINDPKSIVIFLRLATSVLKF